MERGRRVAPTGKDERRGRQWRAARLFSFLASIHEAVSAIRGGRENLILTRCSNPVTNRREGTVKMRHAKNLQWRAYRQPLDSPPDQITEPSPAVPRTCRDRTRSARQ